MYFFWRAAQLMDRAALVPKIGFGIGVLAAAVGLFYAVRALVQSRTDPSFSAKRMRLTLAGTVSIVLIVPVAVFGATAIGDGMTGILAMVLLVVGLTLLALGERVRA